MPKKCILDRDFNRIRNMSLVNTLFWGTMIMGNSEKIKRLIFKLIKIFMDNWFFKLMLNEHTYIQKGNDKIALIGVENWA
jgi:hypothetical protein